MTRNYTALILGGHSDSSRQLLSDVYRSGIALTSVEEKNDLFDSICKLKPNLILLNLDKIQQDAMPLLEKIKNHDKTDEIPVIVLASTYRPELVVRAYDLGAFDFLKFGTQSTEVTAILQRAISVKNKEIFLQQKIDKSKTRVLKAMEDAGTLGALIQFLEESKKCNGYPVLADRIFIVFEDLHIKGSVVFHTSENESQYFSNAHCNRLAEHQIIKQFKQYHKKFGNKLNKTHACSDRIVAIIGEHASLLVRNCPDDKVKRHQLENVLEAFICCIDSRAADFKTKHNNKQQKTVSELLKSSVNFIIKIQTSLEVHERETFQIMENLIETMETGLSILGLTEDQSIYFSNFLNKAHNKLVSLHAAGLDMSDHLQEINHILKRIQAEML